MPRADQMQQSRPGCVVGNRDRRVVRGEGFPGWPPAGAPGSLEVGTPLRAKRPPQGGLLDHGVYATLAFYPGMPRKEVGFRLQLTAATTDQQVTELLAVLDELPRRSRCGPSTPD